MFPLKQGHPDPGSKVQWRPPSKRKNPAYNSDLKIARGSLHWSQTHKNNLDNRSCHRVSAYPTHWTQMNPKPLARGVSAALLLIPSYWCKTESLQGQNLPQGHTCRGWSQLSLFCWLQRLNSWAPHAFKSWFNSEQLAKTEEPIRSNQHIIQGLPDPRGQDSAPSGHYFNVSSGLGGSEQARHIPREPHESVKWGLRAPSQMDPRTVVLIKMSEKLDMQPANRPWGLLTLLHDKLWEADPKWMSCQRTFCCPKSGEMTRRGRTWVCQVELHWRFHFIAFFLPIKGRGCILSVLR